MRALTPMALLLALALAACSDTLPGSRERAPTTSPALTADECADTAAATIDPACFIEANAAHVLRSVCGLLWIAPLCEAVAFPETGYAVSEDPSPDQPYFLAVGAMHEHSGYSDGDPSAIPADYFTSGRTGHNVHPDDSDTGVILDFMMSSEHSDNEKLPITTSAACIPFSQNFSQLPGSLADFDPTALVNLLDCSNLLNPDHYVKWDASLQQAQQGSDTEVEGDGRLLYTGFTGLRGFEWTNDYYNHLNVYLSTNVVNAKVDGSYASMQFMWSWLQTPVAEGGGADALVTFNHPGGNPALTPFDGGLPHGELLALLGGANWNDLEYVPEVDARVVGIEVNGGDDIEWYVKALNRGWHLGPVAAEDEHQRKWSTSGDGKTVMLTRGRDPKDYYWAFANRRTQAVRHEVIDGLPGEKAEFPKLYYYANGDSVQTGIPLGSIVKQSGPHQLHVEAEDLPAGARLALITRAGGQAAPVPLGAADEDGAFRDDYDLLAPAEGEDWYFVVACPAAETACGSNQNHLVVTAPIWFGPTVNAD